jgi:hypothetical protein
MKKVTINLILALLTSCLSFGQYYSWAKGMGGTANEYANSIQLDGSNNTYITGNFAGTADFDPGAGVANLNGHANFFDIFIARYDNAGNYIWAKNIGGRGDDVANSLKLDTGGNLYITGSFEDTVDFDPGPGIANLTSANGDLFIAKYDNSGNYLWAKKIGGSGCEGYDIELDNSGNIYLTGYYFQTNDFDPGVGVATLTAPANNAFIAKYDNSGNYIWAKGIGGSSNNYGLYLTLDAPGNIYLTGNFMGTSDFDPGTRNIHHDLFRAFRYFFLQV